MSKSRHSSDNPVQPKSPSIDPAEVAKFAAMAEDWWNPYGKFRPLHKFNPIRLAFIRDTVAAHFGRSPLAPLPLKDLKLLDIGCGGGLLSEPMTRLGAIVTGVDATLPNVKTALTHAAQSGLNIDYRHGTAEGLLAAGEGPYDIVLNMEVVEHVADAAAFLKDSAKLVAPGGLMIIATINRTIRALAFAIIGAERILRWLPEGTHDFDKLIKPSEIEAALAGQPGLSLDAPIGVMYNPLLDRWSLGRDTGMNYMIVVKKT
ncbi:bifunctional 2-polyprenyl-6-hydroxyphenol methylase/3-demethylubiquinol 3-O-methyltransferase UbiG [Candidatus Phycosocius spiralis]|uniref:Ubiquinone biosynthesis O-methyltransferase n=1 Tax=Candidatus Phycosocius spiralis TaxID=2815099 RepID=A0ABQ4PVB8_9PROT|nr:bifunctional 2-polyprenyl-6-hydroxyphenol methylase/3-demethylubiquinol 3-O-methyltransferase UbiG [Candidatus Phycosocius spiralis]GIU66938.1 ubiquinone biosynthesis O-methyltransferase [Candidatus Phycosocius spiralis]